MRKESLESVLEAARKLSLDEQHRLAEQIEKELEGHLEQRLKQLKEEIEEALKQEEEEVGQLKEQIEQLKKKYVKSKAKSYQPLRALEAVEKTRGSMKGLDRDTIIWLAEDEELCGY